VAEKHVLKYLRGTIYYGLNYVHGDGFILMGYIDLD
jgi:hypothetical protein